MLDRVPGPRRAGLLDRPTPPHRSTTVSPPTVRQTEAPTSPRSREVLLEGFGDALEARLAGAVDVMSRPACGIGSLKASSRKRAAWRQAGVVDAVADALGDVQADLHAVLAQHLGGALGQDMRQHLVAVAVRQQHRRPRLDLVLQHIRPGQHAGEADDAGEWLGAAQADMQRHHRALREADQRGLALVEPVLGHRLVEEGIDERRGAAHAGQRERRIEARDAEPLVAHRIALAGIGRVGRMEHHVGHQRRQHRREPDQVVAVGAVAVQQDHQMAGLAARCAGRSWGLRAWSFAFDSTFGAFALQSGMLRR